VGARAGAVSRPDRPRLAFATYREAPALTEDDRLVVTALARRGVAVEPVVWNALDVDWSALDRIVIRSTWDYHLEPDAYARWLRSFLARPGSLWNPPTAVLGNLDKRYLIDLAGQGVPVVPTAHVPRGEGQTLRDVLEKHRWDEVVVKPAVSASARGTWRSALSTAAADEARFVAQTRAQDVLVQPYCPEIAGGEWSLIFFEGRYSHAVLKRPAAGDFRVQRHLGGHPEAAAPGARLVDEAAAALAALGPPLLYARVDGIERDGGFVLMELEINEPFLFLALADGAPARFADAIARVLSG
jgi:glutathione synthase/RimK-type ligase-like ATP-grasp enzyme